MGMRGEFQKQSGKKLAFLNKIVSKRTDFLILTETKTHHSSLQNRKINKVLTPILYTTQQDSRGGVAIFSNSNWQLLEGSLRESSIKGHYIMGVMQNNAGRRIIIAGIYGKPDNADKESESILESLRISIHQLKFLYNAHEVFLWGDFNLHRKASDTYKNEIVK